MPLQRQFPGVTGTDPAGVLELFRRLGPIQSQVPRSPFLTAASRLPGTPYAMINALFESHELTKTSSIRGTVFTSTGDQLSWLDAVARHTRRPWLARLLVPSTITVEAVTDEIETFCADQWRTRDEVVSHVASWLASTDPEAATRVTGSGVDGHLWGHSGLLRRPKDAAWDKRTDIYRRTARVVLPNLELPTFEEALPNLVRVHLGAYGPARREDLAFFFLVRLGELTTALRALGEEVVRLPGPDGQDYLDLAEPPQDGNPDPGLRLLPEFDGLLLGYAGRNRTRFVTVDQLPRVWAKVNGLFSPVVLYDGRLVASWKTISKGRRTDIEVSMLPPHRALPADLFDAPVRAVERALNLSIQDVRVHTAD